MKKNKRVLIVDDDDEVLEATRTALTAHGYDVIVAHDGDEGLMRSERDAPDLIVLDVLMPKRSGFGVLQKLCYQGEKGPRIVVVTANDEQRHRDFAQSKGADAFLGKPFEMHELLAVVDSLLGGPGERRA
jgi:DNA-binding response OmpR family regulator